MISWRQKILQQSITGVLFASASHTVSTASNLTDCKPTDYLGTMQKAVSGLQIGAQRPCQHSHCRQPMKVRAVAATEVKAGAAAKRKQLGDSDLQVSRKPNAPFVLLGSRISRRSRFVCIMRYISDDSHALQSLNVLSPKHPPFGRPPAKQSESRYAECCLGTMTWGVQNKESEAHQQLSYAVQDMGLNFFDTAEIYPVPPR